MTRAVYQVRLIVKPEYEEEFNAWYEGWYIPKLMAEVPHFLLLPSLRGRVQRAKYLHNRL